MSAFSSIISTGCGYQKNLQPVTCNAGSVTRRLLSSTASKVHGSSSWRGMDGECTYRLHLLEDRATALLHASCTHRCSPQRCTATFLLRFLAQLAAPASGHFTRKTPALPRVFRVRPQRAQARQSVVAQFITATRGRKVDCLASCTDQTCCSVSSILRGCAVR